MIYSYHYYNSRLAKATRHYNVQGDEIVNDFIVQYPPLTIKGNAECHDRLIVTDYGLPAEQVYHCGASSKDAGKKLCAINKIENVAMIHPVIDKLLLASDKQI